MLRFSGIEITGAADADPWMSVDAGTLDTIAARTVEDVYAWINRLPQPAATATPAAAAGSLPAGTL